jgi:hypothetical protein
MNRFDTDIHEQISDLVRDDYKKGGESMTGNGIITIHGKEYMTVARRVELAHESAALEGLETDVLSHSPVVVRAKVLVKGKIFTGISAVNPDSSKLIDKENPYEVAETSAVGRALGFAGYGVIESIASADEMVRATAKRSQQPRLEEATRPQLQLHTEASENEVTCEVCGKPATEKKGTTKGGKPYHGIFCSTEDRGHTRWLWN